MVLTVVRRVGRVGLYYVYTTLRVNYTVCSPQVTTRSAVLSCCD